MLIKTIALLKNFNKYWFILVSVIIFFVIISIIFLKVFVWNDFLIKFPENCESEFNTCIKENGELKPNRFLFIKENYFFQNCSKENFDLCFKKCEKDKVCKLEINNNNKTFNKVE